MKNLMIDTPELVQARYFNETSYAGFDGSVVMLLAVLYVLGLKQGVSISYDNDFWIVLRQKWEQINGHR